MRKAAAVSLTDSQRERLERLWFSYGNRGPKSTPGNHQFIQGLLERGEDDRPLFTRRTRKAERPTPECEREVDAVLAMGDEPPGGRQTTGHSLRVVADPDERPRPKADPELREVLDDMRQRYRVARERLDSEPEAPDAA